MTSTVTRRQDAPAAAHQQMVAGVRGVELADDQPVHLHNLHQASQPIKSDHASDALSSSRGV
jgi:hypothetical protein